MKRYICGNCRNRKKEFISNRQGLRKHLKEEHLGELPRPNMMLRLWLPNSQPSASRKGSLMSAPKACNPVVPTVCFDEGIRVYKSFVSNSSPTKRGCGWRLLGGELK